MFYISVIFLKPIIINEFHQILITVLQYFLLHSIFF